METNDFPWSELVTDTDSTGGQNFEDIAFSYVEATYSDFNWRKTKNTRDGNKDAYAIISIFSIKQIEAEVWMEAKFSLKKKAMSRYTIDNTIVSALSNGSVSELFFVTNMLVNHRVREQALSALKNDGFDYRHVHFCTKYDLEIWLTNTKEGLVLFSKHFKDYRAEDYLVSDLTVLGSPSFYDPKMNDVLFPEPLPVLRNGLSYSADIRLFSRKETNIQCTVPNHSALFFEKPFLFHIHKGINELTLPFSIRQTENSSKTFLLSDGNKEVTVELSIPILNAGFYNIPIESQNTIRKAILKIFRNYEETDRGCVIQEITAPAGMGKSYLLNEITGDKCLCKKDIIFYSFSPVCMKNYHILAELYLRLFYYSAMIDDNIPSNVPQELLDIHCLLKKNDGSALDAWMRSSRNVQLIPMDYQKDRIIVLDNTERLSDSQREFLIAFITGISCSKSHSFIILSGRQQYFFGSPFNIVLKNNDIFNALTKSQVKIEPSTLAILRNIIYDISSLSLLLEKQRENDRTSLINILVGTNYKNAVKHLLTVKFTDVKTHVDKRAWNVLTLIYTLFEGLSYEHVGDDRVWLQTLIGANLVKSGTNGFSPVNSLLCSFFREQYTSYDIHDDILNKHFGYFSEDEKLRFRLGGCGYVKHLEEALERTNYYLRTNDYVSIAYILEPLFSPSNKVNMWDESPLSIRLRYNYIYAKANVDTNYEVRKEFQKFADDIRYEEDPDSIICRIQALAEVVCFSFEDADFSTVRSVTDEVESLSQELSIEDSRVTNAKYLCDSTRVLTLCAEDNYSDADSLLKEMELKHGERIGLYVTKARYAHRISHNDIEKALGILEEVLPFLEKEHNDKWSYSCLLDIKFLHYLQEANDVTFFDGIDTLQELLPRYVSHYRSSLRTLAACALVSSTRKISNNLLGEFKNYWNIYKNEAGSRFKQEIGYDGMIEAAKAYLENNYDEMISQLESTRSFFLQFGDTYKSIIQHNLSIIAHLDALDKKVLFYNSNIPMKKDYFYLDPRMG